jgi:hypothetical protein
MKNHPMMLATLTISILTAGQALAVQNLPATSPPPAGSVDWLGLVESLTDTEPGLIRVGAPDALARELDSLSTDMLADVESRGANWGMSFAVDGAEAPGTNGRYNFDRIDEIARPATPAWCNRDVSYAATDAAGVSRFWQECSGTPPGEDAETISVRRFWIEDTVSGDYRWLEFTAVTATDTASELPALDTFSREALGAIARHIVLFPPAADE